MPIFEYVCQDCGTSFEKLVRSSTSNGQGTGVECPSCGKDHLTQQYSTFAARANGVSKEASMPSCPGGMCQTPGLCGRN